MSFLSVYTTEYDTSFIARLVTSLVIDDSEGRMTASFISVVGAIAG
jgi:hypothetical protein